MPLPLSPEQKQLWEERVLKHQESGLSVSHWCKVHNINYDAMLYWKKQFGFSPAKPIEKSSFKELPLAKDTPPITLEYERIQIHLPKNCDPSLVASYLQALKDPA